MRGDGKDKGDLDVNGAGESDAGEDGAETDRANVNGADGKTMRTETAPWKKR